VSAAADRRAAGAPFRRDGRTPAGGARGRRGARRRGAAAWLLLALAAASVGCGGARLWLKRPARLAPCPGPLVPVGLLEGGDFLLRERVRVRGGGVDAGFELVAERRGERLVVVGLGAFGEKAFTVTQEGLAVEASSALGPALAVPPENLLRDLHAARFARPGAAARAEVARPGCGYTATFVRVERRPLPQAPTGPPG
jgi:hypothetical protein